MKTEKIFKTILVWLPSVIITMFFIPNALEKIFQSNQLDKVITNSTVIIIVGIILLIGTVLFLINKTIIWGTTILVLYMTFIVFIHMYKGKPYEVVILIVMTTIFAAYIRKPQLFHQTQK
jgi:chromate transport protein ChrA